MGEVMPHGKLWINLGWVAHLLWRLTFKVPYDRRRARNRLKKENRLGSCFQPRVRRQPAANKPLWQRSLAPKPQPQALLMQLPQEIRDMIWDYCFTVPVKYSLILDPDNHCGVKPTVDTGWYLRPRVSWMGPVWCRNKFALNKRQTALLSTCRALYLELHWRMFTGATIRIWSLPYLLEIDQYLPPLAHRVIRRLKISFMVGIPPMFSVSKCPWAWGHCRIHPAWQKFVDKLSDLKNVKVLELDLCPIFPCYEDWSTQGNLIAQKLAYVDGPMISNRLAKWSLNLSWPGAIGIVPPANFPFEMKRESRYRLYDKKDILEN